MCLRFLFPFFFLCVGAWAPSTERIHTVVPRLVFSPLTKPAGHGLDHVFAQSPPGAVVYLALAAHSWGPSTVTK